MRTVPDRIRHALSFEIIGLILVTPFGALIFDTPMLHISVVALVSATIATCWNYLFNLLFDHAMLRMTGNLRKSLMIRLLHACLYELGLLLALIPFIVWYLRVSMVEAVLMDITFALFYMAYAFAFNWLYDIAFPLPEWQSSKAAKR